MIPLPIRHYVDKIGNTRHHFGNVNVQRAAWSSQKEGLNDFAECSLAIGLIGDGASSAFGRLVFFFCRGESARATLIGVKSNTSGCADFKVTRCPLFM